MQAIDYRKKICLIGDPGVGKTSLIRRFVYDKFDDKYLSTMGVKVSKKVVEVGVNDRRFRISLQIWDTMGQREFRSLLVQYFKGAEGAFVVCDITNQSSLEGAEEWVKLLFSVSGRVPVIFLANKIDLQTSAQFSPEDLNTLVEKYGCTFFATSAKNGQNVQESFVELTKILVQDKCVDDGTDELRAAAKSIADLFIKQHGEAMAHSILKEQFRRVNMDYSNLDRTPATSNQLEQLIENLVQITSDFKGEDIARTERQQFLKLLKRSELQ